MGYIGLPLIAAFASRGCQMLGIDVDKKKIQKLKKTYKTDIYEPGVNDALARYRKNIEFTSDYKKAVKECQTILVTVGTPLKNNNQPDFSYLDNVVDMIGGELLPGQLIMFKSTVMPGLTRKLAEKLEKKSKMKAGKDFYVVFCPERTVEGRALYELYNLPKIVGGISKESLERGAKIIKILGGKVLKVSSLEIAEMCKCVDNVYRATNIAFGNEIGNICEKTGIDSYELAKAVNYTYPRTNLFLPGLGAGGPCLSKDPQILKYFAHQNKVGTSVINASIERNKSANLRVAFEALKFIKKNKIKNPKIVLLGVAFKGKPATDDIRNSPALDVYHELKNKLKGASFTFYDPLTKDFAGNKVSKNLWQSVKGVNVAIFLTNHVDLIEIDAAKVLKEAGRPLLIVDCWHNLKNLEVLKEENIKIFRIGDNLKI